MKYKENDLYLFSVIPFLQVISFTKFVNLHVVCTDWFLTFFCQLV